MDRRNNGNSIDWFMAYLITFFLLILNSTVSYAQFIDLNQAIAIAIQKNPTLRDAKLDRTSQKFSLKVTRYAYQPNYFISGQSNLVDENLYDINERTLLENLEDSSEVSPSVAYKSMMGTELKLHSSISTKEGFVPSVEIRQPLLRGFSPTVNAIPINNAIDQEEINQIAYRATIANVLSETIIAYLEVSESDRLINSALRSIKLSRIEVKKSLIKFSRGLESQKALDTSRVSLDQSLSNLSDTKSTRQTKINQLKDLLNIDVNSPIEVQDVSEQLKALYPIPDESIATKAILRNNPEYQQLLLQHQQTKRAVIKAKDDQKWDLNVSSVTDLINPKKSTVGLHLSIPIGDLNRKKSLIDANVNVRKSDQVIQAKERSLINKVHDTIKSASYDLVTLSNLQRELSRRDALIKALQLRLNNDQISLFDMNREIAEREETADHYSSTLIAYLSKMVILYKDMGLTLGQWHVKV